MKKLLYAKDSEEFWRVFNAEQDKRRAKLSRLPFSRKLEILEKMRADVQLTRRSFRPAQRPPEEQGRAATGGVRQSKARKALRP